ncbi:MAG: aldehyde dehydrogenase family protein, partial [Planctomycetota bacterium]
MPTNATASLLKHEPCSLIAGEPIAIPGDTLVSTNPARPSDPPLWSGSPNAEHVQHAIDAAREALPAWSRTPIEKRIEALRAYQTIVRERAEEFGVLISEETGKALWDATGEAKILGGKVDITLDESEIGGRRRVTPFELSLGDTRRGVCSFRPHGVMAVIGPFNFPAHLPNGHIVPALLTGNTVVFKPSDKTPAVGQALAEAFNEALESVGAPSGVVNLVQGATDVASALVSHDDIDGILFTGSWPVGRKILEANLDRPGRIVALELGGNNAAVVLPDADLKQAAIECARAAFVTTGQRCTCTRRIVVHESIAPKFIPLLQKIAGAMLIGDPRGEGGQQPFMGPLINEESRQNALAFQDSLASQGGRVLTALSAVDHPSGGAYVSPGIVEVDSFVKDADPSSGPGCDVELFGPLVRVTTVDSLDGAMQQCNATAYGLAAAIFTRDEAAIDRVQHEAHAGCGNGNTGPAGASGQLPVG